MSSPNFTTTFFSVYFSACVIGYEERGVKNCEWQNPKEQEQTEGQPDRPRHR
jgi:hypothetical protein